MATVKSFKANTQNVSFETLNDGQLTLSTHLMKPNYITNRIHVKCENKNKKFQKGKRKKNRKEMVRLSPEGIVNFFFVTVSLDLMEMVKAAPVNLISLL